MPGVQPFAKHQVIPKPKPPNIHLTTILAIGIIKYFSLLLRLPKKNQLGRQSHTIIPMRTQDQQFQDLQE